MSVAPTTATLNNIMVENDILETKVIEGLEQGRREGRREGRKEGLEEGRKEGLEEGRKEGLGQGRAEGMEQGRAEGMEQGRAEGIHAIAAKMKEHGMAASVIAAMTSLKEDEINQL